MKVISFVSAVIFFAFGTMSLAQSPVMHNIDKELDECVEKSENFTTQGTLDCIVKATEKWDKELNVKYKALMKLLTPDQKVKLKLSQKAWLDYRGKEISFSGQLYRDKQGTMWIPVAAETKMDLTKQRTL
jgi:uncharacterized protein YecT (DUF1311 family)